MNHESKICKEGVLKLLGTCLKSLPTTCFKNNNNSPINSTIYSTTVGELADATSLIVLTELGTVFC